MMMFKPLKDELGETLTPERLRELSEDYEEAMRPPLEEVI
jgi:hypothetical protein